eukprot:TRINITY_DN195_c0_g1_i8.p1 TRINITY_DN195_c0_g1~~TRINITY_DN195_c0_g1_i8.p1  ORF type:complete len:1653 (-),score=529.31 TRINITY_DN195_c0_g1_i8:513-5471(-)
MVHDVMVDPIDPKSELLYTFFKRTYGSYKACGKERVPTDMILFPTSLVNKEGVKASMWWINTPLSKQEISAHELENAASSYVIPGRNSWKTTKKFVPLVAIWLLKSCTPTNGAWNDVLSGVPQAKHLIKRYHPKVDVKYDQKDLREAVKLVNLSLIDEILKDLKDVHGLQDILNTSLVHETHEIKDMVRLVGCGCTWHRYTPLAILRRFGKHKFDDLAAQFPDTFVLTESMIHQLMINKEADTVVEMVGNGHQLDKRAVEQLVKSKDVKLFQRMIDVMPSECLHHTLMQFLETGKQGTAFVKKLLDSKHMERMAAPQAITKVSNMDCVDVLSMEEIMKLLQLGFRLEGGYERVHGMGVYPVDMTKPVLSIHHRFGRDALQKVLVSFDDLNIGRQAYDVIWERKDEQSMLLLVQHGVKPGGNFTSNLWRGNKTDLVQSILLALEVDVTDIVEHLWTTNGFAQHGVSSGLFQQLSEKQRCSFNRLTFTTNYHGGLSPNLTLDEVVILHGNGVRLDNRTVDQLRRKYGRAAMERLDLDFGNGTAMIEWAVKANDKDVIKDILANGADDNRLGFLVDNGTVELVAFVAELGHATRLFSIVLERNKVDFVKALLPFVEQDVELSNLPSFFDILENLEWEEVVKLRKLGSEWKGSNNHDPALKVYTTFGSTCLLQGVKELSLPGLNANLASELLLNNDTDTLIALLDMNVATPAATTVILKHEGYKDTELTKHCEPTSRERLVELLQYGVSYRDADLVKWIVRDDDRMKLIGKKHFNYGNDICALYKNLSHDDIFQLRRLGVSWSTYRFNDGTQANVCDHIFQSGGIDALRTAVNDFGLTGTGVMNKLVELKDVETATDLLPDDIGNVTKEWVIAILKSDSTLWDDVLNQRPDVLCKVFDQQELSVIRTNKEAFMHWALQPEPMKALATQQEWSLEITSMHLEFLSEQEIAHLVNLGVHWSTGYDSVSIGEAHINKFSREQLTRLIDLGCPVGSWEAMYEKFGSKFTLKALKRSTSKAGNLRELLDMAVENDDMVMIKRILASKNIKNVWGLDRLNLIHSGKPELFALMPDVLVLDCLSSLELEKVPPIFLKWCLDNRLEVMKSNDFKNDYLGPMVKSKHLELADLFTLADLGITWVQYKKDVDKLCIDLYDRFGLDGLQKATEKYGLKVRFMDICRKALEKLDVVGIAECLDMLTTRQVTEMCNSILRSSDNEQLLVKMSEHVPEMLPKVFVRALSKSEKCLCWNGFRQKEVWKVLLNQLEGSTKSFKKQLSKGKIPDDQWKDVSLEDALCLHSAGLKDHLSETAGQVYRKDGWDAYRKFCADYSTNGGDVIAQIAGEQQDVETIVKVIETAPRTLAPMIQRLMEAKQFETIFKTALTDSESNVRFAKAVCRQLNTELIAFGLESGMLKQLKDMHGRGVLRSKKLILEDVRGLSLGQIVELHELDVAWKASGVVVYELFGREGFDQLEGDLKLEWISDHVAIAFKRGDGETVVEVLEKGLEPEEWKWWLDEDDDHLEVCQALLEKGLLKKRLMWATMNRHSVDMLQLIADHNGEVEFDGLQCCDSDKCVLRQRIRQWLSDESSNIGLPVNVDTMKLAISVGNQEFVEECLENSVIIERSFVELAIKNGHLEVMKLLLERTPKALINDFVDGKCEYEL